MKCPNKNCGPWNTPTLRDAGIGTLKRCPICKQYFTTEGELVDDPLEYNKEKEVIIDWDYEDDEDYSWMHGALKENK